MNWYYKLLAQRPHLIVVAVGVFSIACIVVSLTVRKLPDFGDPTLGFEARGTSLGQRLTAWRNLLEETRPSGLLSANPNEYIQPAETIPMKPRKPSKFSFESKKRKEKKKNLKKKLKLIKEITTNKTNYDLVNFEEYDDNDTFSNLHDRFEYGKNLSYTSDEVTNKRIQLKKNQWKSLLNLNPPPLTTDIHLQDGLFCDSPRKEYAHFVVQRNSDTVNESLYELKSLQAICDLEDSLARVESYRSVCQKELNSNTCCRIWSLPAYIALLSNKTACNEIDELDILNVRSLLMDCFPYYHSLKLSNDCVGMKCRVPNECTQHNAVYNILHFLVDTEFMKLNETNNFLNVSMIFLPIARSTQSLPFYYNLMEENLSNDLVSIVAMDMGLKNALFDDCLLSDGWLIGMGGLFVVTSMLIYTASIFITIMTVIAVIFSLGIAYFIYTFVYELTFFPFMNLLAVIVVIGIGADDAFIFIKLWHCVLSDRVKSSGVPLTSTSSYCSDASRNDTLSNFMAETLRHAALSMLVTSLTTSAAFFASYISSITAVRLFGIFAGTTVIANYFLMVTWLPAAISIAERITCFSTISFFKLIANKIQSPFKNLCQLGQCVEEAIISAIINYSKLWILVLGVIGVLSGVMVLYYPQLKLPDSPDFKLFVSNHPFELYDSTFKNFFWFEKSYMSNDNYRLPLRFVWGVKPTDRGNYFDPVSRGDLVLDDSFNISSMESQVWLLNFCARIKKQTFYQTNYGMFFGLLPHCFIENFVSWMSRRCYDDMSDQDRTPCCEISTFPFSPSIFDECLPQSISSMYETPREYFIPGVAGPKFSKHPATTMAAILAQQLMTTESEADDDDNNNNNYNNNVTNSYTNFSTSISRSSSNFSNSISINVSNPVVKAIVIEYDSTLLYTMSYTEVANFVQHVEQWMADELKTAPLEMKNGWFISDLEFYDLQNTLSDGTIIAICVSMSVALLVLLLVTLNLLISLYAIITVTFTILSTVAVLILLGWKLNVLESVAVTTAIGLSVDFSLHYGVQYRLSPDLDRSSSTRYSLSRMIGPTAMAAVTTGAAGAFMLPSNVLPYIQIGIFLIVVMAISWIYSTFFLMSMLRFVGPQYGFGQFRYPKFKGTARENKNLVKNQTDNVNRSTENQFNVSDQLLSGSSSAAGELVGSESHELDSLTSNSVIKPTTVEATRPINFERAFKKKYSYPKDQSPSTVSAITVVMPDDHDNNHY